jgi:hypothetical protein
MVVVRPSSERTSNASRSWLLKPFRAAPGALRPLGAALVLVTLVTFVLAGVKVIGLLPPNL